MKSSLKPLEKIFWALPLLAAILVVINLFAEFTHSTHLNFVQQGTLGLLVLYYLPQFKINNQWMALLFLLILPMGRLCAEHFWPTIGNPSTDSYIAAWTYIRTIGLFGYAFTGGLFLILPKAEKQQKSSLYYGFAALVVVHFAIQLFYGLEYPITNLMYIIVAIVGSLMIKNKLAYNDVERAQVTYITIDAIAMSLPIIINFLR